MFYFQVAFSMVIRKRSIVFIAGFPITLKRIEKKKKKKKPKKEKAQNGPV